MTSKGIAVSAPRGAYYMLDSGDPEEDEKDAEKLKEQLGREAIVRSLGGAKAYDGEQVFPPVITGDVIVKYSENSVSDLAP